jgi:ribonucrease Y
VNEVFALQAGREVRVVVDPGEIGDMEARELSRQIARKLEEDLQYPGQIQVTVIREFRATDYAR